MGLLVPVLRYGPYVSIRTYVCEYGTFSTVSEREGFVVSYLMQSVSTLCRQAV